ncbi:MAG TPA: PH domain-containing protein [Lacunisphaera sp.]|nr:PH domain-containing protein [Lacunisphaera sp.]
MYQQITALVLALLKVPHEPQPPHGDPSSLQVFRAGRNFLRLKFAAWGLGQVLAFAGIVFWLVVFVTVESDLHARRQNHQEPVSFKDVRDFDEYLEKIGAAKPADRQSAARPAAPGRKARPRAAINGWAGFKRMLVEVSLWLPLWAFPLLWVIKIIGFLVYLAQLAVTYVVTRLDYELRWYMVTDRSLRIRHGVWKVAESTMSFANIQQVVVSQGPLQRLLGLADVKVQSAGGGSSGVDSHGSPKGGEDMHLGLFHSVTNAPEIRDLILERLRRFRESGLGDPDEKTAGHQPIGVMASAAISTMPASPDLLSAVRELAAEARALRVALD